MDIIGSLAAPEQDPEAGRLGGGFLLSPHGSISTMRLEGGARLGSSEHPGRAGQIPEAVGPGVAARRERKQATEVTA